ncbi:MAG: excinuclease ABC subunit UvrC [Armatimonadetes bacterium]|nr:excinuclease ABC subunit UvrC [Armatimonadota bacterium]
MNADLEKKLAHVPAKPGAYMMKDERGEVIYVGKAASLRARVRSYFQKGQMHPAKVSAMIAKVADVDWLVTDSEVEALMLECNLIKQHRPRYNVRLRDDKHYPYLCVTLSEPFPRVVITRRSKQDGNKYFGPYTNSEAVRDTQRLIRKVFKIRSCNKKLSGSEQDRPCLNYHLEQCLSPCSGKIGAEEYAILVRDTCLFLEGRHESLVKRMVAEMELAAENLEFERAARLRDQIEAINKVVERQKIISTAHAEQDVISLATKNGTACVQVFFIRSGRLIGQETFFMEGITDETAEHALEEFVKQYYGRGASVPPEILISHELPDREVIEEWLKIKRGGAVRLTYPRRGEKKKIVEMAAVNAALAAEREAELSAEDESRKMEMVGALMEVLELPKLPRRIEAYDISNIQGMQAVGSMVVFEDGMPAKSDYRRFKIRTIDQPDDYGMMREVLRRRFAKKEEERFANLPDLLLIDGGRGQLNTALEVLSEAGLTIPVVGLAKQFEEIYVPERPEPMLLPPDSKALHLLQQIRDEAHRFALAYHQKLREKKAKKSLLDDIPGIGPKRRRALIKQFGSVVAIKQASIEDLLKVPGITKPIAEEIHERLKNS